MKTLVWRIEVGLITSEPGVRSAVAYDVDGVLTGDAAIQNVAAVYAGCSNVIFTVVGAREVER